MKAINLIICMLIFSNLFSQEIKEKEIISKVNEVTVFLDGAQIVRKKTIDLPEGKTILKFTKLSPYVDAKSIQVKATGPLTVLSVNHQQNYLHKAKKPDEQLRLEKLQEELQDKIKIEQTYLDIITEELAFLEENRNIGGKNEQVSATNLQQTSEFFSNKLTSLKMKEIERYKNLRTLKNQSEAVGIQIQTLSNKKEYPTGEIVVKVDAKTATSFSLELTYLVANAGWFPSYDIRAKNINEPVQLIYKANVKQDTKSDWDNVKLKFSSATPNVSGVAPELQTYVLNYNRRPPVYKSALNSVSGTVYNEQGYPLAGANVTLEGSTIGTSTDLDGNYSLTLPKGSNRLQYSYIGCEPMTLPVSQSVMNVSLQENSVHLSETVAVGYAEMSKIDKLLSYRTSGVASTTSSTLIRGTSTFAIPFEQIENQTTIDFEINTPYSIKSDNKNYSVDMALYDLPAFYQYYSVPKIDKDAFLIANVIDWEKYNLMEGEANVFFEDTYVGKTLLDVRFATDTLQISLGRDKKVWVSREKIKEYSTKQFIGSKKEETRAWKTVVKNNKNQSINMIVLDQVPISTCEEIEINVENHSNAKRNTNIGEVKWEFELEPQKQKEFELKYSVKYPKHKSLIIE